MNWYYENKELDYEEMPADLVYLTDGVSYLIDPYVTEERFFDWLDEKYGEERMHMIIYNQTIGADTYERLLPRFEMNGRVILP